MGRSIWVLIFFSIVSCNSFKKNDEILKRKVDSSTNETEIQNQFRQEIIESSDKNATIGLIVPFSNPNDFEDICCIYSPKNGFNVYANPNGNLIGKIVRNIESKDVQESQYAIYYKDLTTGKKQKIDLNQIVEIGYEIWSIDYFERQDGFVQIIDKEYNFWLKESEISSNGFGFLGWQKFIIDNAGILLGFYANEPGLKLMSEPNLSSEVLANLKGHTFHISPTNTRNDNWNKVKVIKTKEHPCATDLSEDQNTEYEIQGWLELVDEKGNPNVWYYARGC